MEYVLGKRDTRFLPGDVIITERDILSARKSPDACVPTFWDISLHGLLARIGRVTDRTGLRPGIFRHKRDRFAYVVCAGPDLNVHRLAQGSLFRLYPDYSSADGR